MTESSNAPPGDGSAAPDEDAHGHPAVLLHPWLVTVAAVVMAALITLTGQAGDDLLAVAVALGGVVLAWGWPGTWSLPSPRGTATVLLLGTIALVLTVALSSTPPYLDLLPAALAGGVLASFVHQLARRDGRPRLVESVATTVTGLAVVASGAALITMPRLEQGPWFLTAGMVAVAVGAVVDLGGRVPALQVWTLPVGMALACVASVAVGHAGGLGWAPCLVLGVAASGVSHAVRRLFGVLPTLAGHRPQVVAGAASVLLCGVLVVVVQRVFPA